MWVSERMVLGMYFEITLCGGPLESRIWENLLAPFTAGNVSMTSFTSSFWLINFVLWNWKYCNLLKSVQHRDLFQYNVLKLDM